MPELNDTEEYRNKIEENKWRKEESRIVKITDEERKRMKRLGGEDTHDGAIRGPTEAVTKDEEVCEYRFCHC